MEHTVTSEDDMAEKSETSLSWFNQGMHLLIPFLLVAVGGLVTWMQKIDDRMYSMKDEYISKNDFQAAVTRLETTMDARIAVMEKNLQARQAESSAQMERLIEKVGKVDDKLNNLAVDVEKKTKK